MPQSTASDREDVFAARICKMTIEFRPERRLPQNSP